MKSNDVVAAAIATSTRQRMIEKQSKAAAVFEARWTMNALQREHPDIHEALEDQLGRFHEALVTGEDEEIILHSEAMCRGWAAAITAMEKSGAADDAYHIGQFADVTVCIGRQQHAPEWLRERYGDELVWLTPREVAALFMRIKQAESVKALWPDAEIIDIREKSK